jgi:hypothetical protein
MPENLLTNGGFEADWGEEKSHRCLVFPAGEKPYEKTIENIFTPPHWLTWFRHEPGDWSQPEVTDTKKNHRVHSGEKGMRLFTFQRRHDAGFLQQLEVNDRVVTVFLRSKTLWAFRNSDAYWDDAELIISPEGKLRLTAWAHAWSNHKVAGYEHYGSARCSVGVGCGAQFILEGNAPPLNGDPLNDAIGNFTFYVGIDPTGGINPFADTVVWSRGAHIYNAYAQVPVAEATLDPVPPNPPSQPPPTPPEPRGHPRVQYKRTYVLLPPDADAAWTRAVIQATWDEERYTVGSSADDAGIGNLNERRVIAVNPHHWPGDLHSFFEAYYPGVEYATIEAATPDELAAQLLPTTSPPSPPPPPATSASKLGAHVLRAAAGLGEFIAGKPAVVTLVGDWGMAANIPKGTLVIGAIAGNYDGQFQRASGAPPQQAAQQFVNDALGTYRSNPDIAYWQGHNEPVWNSEDEMGWYAEFEIARMEIMANLGLKCVIGNFATGSPPLHLWPAFIPACQAALEYRAILGLHEYSCPWMWWMTGEHQIDPEEDQGDEGWTTLRYRKVYRQHLIPNEVGDLPLAITEAGIDPLVSPQPPGVKRGTWRQLGDFWREHDGEPDNADYYFRQLVWYDLELQKDPFVIGACVFTWGNWGGTWKHFDVAGTPVAEKLAQHIRDNPARPFSYPGYASTQAKKFEETPYYVPPRESYTHTHVLLPQIEDAVERLDWRTAAAIGSSDQLLAVGHATDNGAGLNDYDLVVVNPDLWNRDLKAWHNQRYPRTSYYTIESDNPWEMAIKLLPILREDIALAQSDSRWADYDFGEMPDAPTGQENIGNYGGLLTNLAIMLRKVYRRDVTPPTLDKLLVAARAAYHEDTLMAWEDTVPLFPIFDQNIKDNTPRSAQALKQLLRDGWEIILREASGDHSVYLEEVKGNTLTIIDATDGEHKEATAADYAGIRAARVRKGGLTDRASLLAGKQPDDSPSQASHKHSYVLLPQIEDSVERLDWRTAAAIGSSDRMWTIGHSADGAGIGPQNREVIAVNPEKWNGNLKTWHDTLYPRIEYQRVETESPWEMAVELLPTLKEDIALAQSDPQWADYDFGAHPDSPNNGETIGGYGCFLTGLAIVLRKVYQRAVTPPVLDRLLVAARAGYFNDNFMAWETAVPLFPAFDDSIKDNKPRSARELKRLLKGGWEIILRRADGGHFVYLEDIEGNTLHIIDTWDGARKHKAATDYAGIRAAHVKPNGNASLPCEVAIGLHDMRGGEWMAGQGLEGCCLVHHVVQRGPIKIDCRQLQKAGITVIARLNWGYADGTGTLPRPQDKNAFVDAAVETVLTAKGVEYFHIGNEPNNRSEWPGFGSNDVFTLSPQYVAEIYNEIWQRVGNRAKIGPPPLDPYFGPGSNNRDWWLTILNNIAGADALFLHAKTQTNDPGEVLSRARFSDRPLTWQYLHLRTVETSLSVVPGRFRSLPVYVTELNPQYLREIKGENGWLPNNAEWVHEALDYFRYERPVTGVIFYRYESAGDQAPYGLEDKPEILEAIKLEMT